MKTFLLASAAVLGFVGTAGAADLPVRMPVKAPPMVAPAFSWTGCYIGANVGGAFDRSDYTVHPSGQFVTDPRYINQNGLRTDSGELNQSNLTVGGQVGCNWQAAPSWLIGFEGDGNWLGLDPSESLTRGLNAPLVGTFTHTVNQRLDWFATARARLGYTAGQFLVYVTGGAAFGEVRSATFVQFSSAGDTYIGSASDTRAGWTAGAGVEYTFDNNWSAKAEYLYVDLGSFSYLNPNVPPPSFPTFSYTTDLNTKFHVLRLGINYRFNWGAAPVVARY